MDADRSGPFWDVVAGRSEPPPIAGLLGWRLLHADADNGRVRVEFTAREEFLNPAGTVQGGMLAAMLDDTMGPALMASAEGSIMAPTVEFKVNFVRPARPGRLIGTGWVVHRGRSLALLGGELHDEDGNLIATATATARLV
ncbi:MAG: PaaI family thioesterase [Actinobacteria bacterium]|nr:MAG: PaaI family thioesterase [Actinomycetota bacterium]